MEAQRALGHCHRELYLWLFDGVPVSTPMPVPAPVAVQRPVPAPVPQVATSSAPSVEYDSGVAFMNTSDPSLAVDVSLSLPSSPTSSTNSETSPLPTVENITGTDELNTAFDGRDFSSISLDEESFLQRCSNT
ncbi:hypothetical protein TELCIR_12319 [Teladorsagia circumcincta]|uniref:Uncharacterized protein n=1 Tax=Teladorsagia circumcincta TaxID=45464 RepID=A0A2G9U6Y5_TELCI|nr:hypothetical protein TELCIR_12319 [Teladorsagia circumcincta]